MYFSHSPSAPSTSYASASPMEIPASSSRSSPSCAYPSWPRRSSLSSNSSDDSDYRNHSFVISDEELFGDVFEDSPVSTPASERSQSPVSPMLREPRFVVETGSLMREVVRQEKARRKRSASSSSKKSRRGSKTKSMSPIQEAVE